MTRQCFDEFHRLFGIRYPFGDYHQAFVPEFNAGAMENPGCVTFRDPLVFTCRVTRGSRIKRATTSRTRWRTSGSATSPPRAWWDDLWLNESFAEYMGNRVTADVTEYDDAWTHNAYARRQWGLIADQRPEHPPGRRQRRRRRRRGAAGLRRHLLRQGLEHPQAAQRARSATRCSSRGVIDHFEPHRFGNATMHDLFASWERAGAGDLSAVTDELAAHRRRGHDHARPRGRRAAPYSPGRRPGRPHPHLPRRHAVPTAGWTAPTVQVGDAPAVRRCRRTHAVVLDPDEDIWRLARPRRRTTLRALPELLPRHRRTRCCAPRSGTTSAAASTRRWSTRPASSTSRSPPSRRSRATTRSPSTSAPRRPAAAAAGGCSQGRPADARAARRAGRPARGLAVARPDARSREHLQLAAFQGGDRARRSTRPAARAGSPATPPTASSSTSTCAGGSWSSSPRSARPTAPSSTPPSTGEPTATTRVEHSRAAGVAARRRGQGLGVAPLHRRGRRRPTTSSRPPARACGAAGRRRSTAPYVDRYFTDLPAHVGGAQRLGAGRGRVLVLPAHLHRPRHGHAGRGPGRRRRARRRPAAAGRGSWPTSSRRRQAVRERVLGEREAGAPGRRSAPRCAR